MSYNKHEATASNHLFEDKMYLQSLTTAYVRGPAKNSGAFVFGLNS